jgi:hypothetical protein
VSLEVVTLTGHFTNGTGQPVTGSVTFIPSAQLTDMTDAEIVVPSVVTVDLNSLGQFSASLYSTDSSNLTPAGWTWQITQNITGLPPYTWNFFLPYGGGATQDISSLTPVPSA